MGAMNEQFSAEDIKAALGKISDQVKEHAEKALAEAKRGGDMAAKNKEEVDKLLVESGELRARILEVEQKQARRGEDEKRGAQSAGQMLVESDSFKAWLAEGGRKRQSGFVFELPHAAIISTATTNTTTVGLNPDMQPGVIPGIPREGKQCF